MRSSDCWHRNCWLIHMDRLVNQAIALPNNWQPIRQQAGIGVWIKSSKGGAYSQAGTSMGWLTYPYIGKIKLLTTLIIWVRQNLITKGIWYKRRNNKHWPPIIINKRDRWNDQTREMTLHQYNNDTIQHNSKWTNTVITKAVSFRFILWH